MAIVTNFVGSTRKSDLARLGRAETTNMFVENVDSDYASQIILRGMPGWGTLYNHNGTPKGIIKASNGKLFYVMGSQLFCNGTPIINVSNSNERVSMCETGGHTPYLLIADGTSLFAVNTTESVVDMQLNYKTIEVPNDPWESTAETPVPGKPIGIAMIYEHPMLLLKNTDRIYMGYQYPWEWQPSEYYVGEKEIKNFNADDLFMLHWQGSDDTELFPEGKWISSDYNNDIANSMVSSRGKLMVGGPASIQAFSYVGGDFVYGEVFSCHQESCSRIGTYTNALTDIAGHYCMVGKDGVYVDGVKVSDDFIDRTIKGNFVAIGNIQWYSHNLLVIYTTNATLAYDISSNSWTNLASYSNNDFTTFRYAIVNGEYGMRNGRVVQMTESKWDEDDGTPIVKRRRGGLMMREGKEMQIDKLKFLDNGGQYEGQANLRIYTDGILSESSLVDFSRLGDYGTPFEWYDLGCAHTFEVELLCDTKSKFGLYGLDVEAVECLH